MTVSEARTYPHRSGRHCLNDDGKPGPGGVPFRQDDLAGHFIIGLAFDDPVDVIGADDQEVGHVLAVLGSVPIGDAQRDVVVDPGPGLDVGIGFEEFGETELGGVRVEADRFLDRT